jgi:translation initiation factor 2B subunit (eIF-2B alpha/beta/delta family)
VSRHWPREVDDVYARLQRYELVGASACVREIVAALDTLAQDALTRNGDVLAEVSEAGRAFCALKPETALYREAVAWLTSALNAAGPTEAAAAIRSRALLFAEHRERSVRRIASHSERVLENVESLLVHDFSSTVMSVLRHASSRGRRLRVLATAAEPVGGGARVAAESAAAGHRAVLLPDTGAARLLGEVDVVLTGVETAYLDGALANTVGTYAVALLAREASVPLYAVTECLKIDRSLRRPRHHAELHAPLLSDWPARPIPADVEVRTEVLDLTPPELITRYVTEQGVLTPGELGVAHRASRLELEELLAEA